MSGSARPYVWKPSSISAFRVWYWMDVWIWATVVDSLCINVVISMIFLIDIFKTLTNTISRRKRPLKHMECGKALIIELIQHC